MKLLFSVPSGYHIRELILPLRPYLESDESISEVHVVTPAARYKEKIFSGFSSKFIFHENADSLKGQKTLIESIRPNVVITNTVGHDELDYPILKTASELGIKTVTFIASWDNVWKVDRLMKTGKPIHIADHIIVWNTMMKQHMRRLFPKLLDDQVEAIGAPRMDYFWHEDKIPTKAQLFNYLGIQDTAKPLIHFSTTELYPMDYVVQAIADAILAKLIPASHLYASVHPGGDITKHKKLEDYGALVRYSFGRQDEPLHPSFAYVPNEEGIYMLVSLFKHADVLINHSSSTALESIIAGTPVINVKYGAPLDWWKWYRSMVYRDFHEHYVDLVEDDATYIVHNKKELVSSVVDALKNPQTKAEARTTTLARMITTTDGTASQKVLASIKQHADA